MVDRIAAADWALRSPGFTELAHYNDGRPIVVMRFEPEVGEVQRQMWTELCELWSELPVHPNVLEAVDHENGTLLLRYATLDWNFQPIEQRDDPFETLIATWGLQLCAAYEAIIAAVAPAMLGRFANSFFHVDLEHNVRVGFRPLSSDQALTHVNLAPELRRLWPHVGRNPFVYLVGKLLDAYLPLDLGQLRRLREIIASCTHPQPHKRFSSLADLRNALLRIGGSVVAVHNARRTALRNLIEEGQGRLALRDLGAALACFEQALANDPTSRLAAEGWVVALGNDDRQRATAELAQRFAARRGLPPRTALSDVQPEAARLEVQREFGDALRLYCLAHPNPRTDAARYTAMARCHLHLHDARAAETHAQRALVFDPDHLEARSIYARALLLGHHHVEALAAVEALLVRAPDDAMAHYTRGKALFALRRLGEARDSFERACQLRPAMLEAMLLRREADRALGGVRRTVGEQPPMIDLPAHLADLRGALAAGRFAEVIAALEPHTDGAARLIRARLLLLENRLDEALGCYASIDAAEHRRDALVGQATVLLELDRLSATRDRATEALALFELALRDAPDDLDIADGRARALAQLGRGAEAEPIFSPQP